MRPSSDAGALTSLDDSTPRARPLLIQRAPVVTPGIGLELQFFKAVLQLGPSRWFTDLPSKYSMSVHCVPRVVLIWATEVNKTAELLGLTDDAS